jgi:outer membrane beta-barrel protein
VCVSSSLVIIDFTERDFTMKYSFPNPRARAWRLLPALALLALAAPEARAQFEPAAAALGVPGFVARTEPASLAHDSSAMAPDTSESDAAVDVATDANEAPASDSVGANAAAASPGVAVNPRIKSVRKVRLVGQAPLVARTGPGASFAIAGVYAKGDAFPVVAKNGDWFGVRLSNSETGWFHASLVKEFDDLSDLEFHPNAKAFSRVGSYTFSGYAGAYSFDRKSNTLVLGGRVGYYVFDRLQAEAGLGWTHVRRPAEIVESLFGLTLEAEDFHMLFYHLNLTWEILPGRQMVPFVGLGVGSSIMQGETEPSVNFGAGTTLFLSKRTAVRWEFRDYRFQSGPDDARVTNDNIEFTLGTVFLF